MTIGMWYRVLLENHVTHNSDAAGSREFRKCRVELKHPSLNWDEIWSLLVLPGLTSELTSFLWLMLHDLLPNSERLFRMNMPNVISSSCSLCSDNVTDSLPHSLIECSFVYPASSFLINTLKQVLPNVTPSQVTLLDLDLSQDLKLPITYLIASFLSQIWKCRISKKQCNLKTIRTNLEASIQVLRKTRHHQAATKLDDFLRL